MGRWRTIEHTADLGLEVEASTLEGLFIACAHGMTGVLMGSEGGAPDGGREATVWHTLDLRAPDIEALLVDWLRELLHIQTSEGLLFATAEFEALDEKGLVARAGLAQPESPDVIERELKGVTYHDLQVGRRNDSWFARIVFDL
jgi:SHS2 domain-containing protein